jgi:hypothetical protein
MDMYAQFGRAELDCLGVVPDDAPDVRIRSYGLGVRGQMTLRHWLRDVDTDSASAEAEEPQQDEEAEEPQQDDEPPMLNFVIGFMQQAQFIEPDTDSTETDDENNCNIHENQTSPRESEPATSHITVWRRTTGLGEKCEMPINGETLVLDVIKHIHTTWPGADAISASIPWRQRTFCGTIRTSSGWVLVPTQLLTEANVNPGDEVFFKIVRTTLLANGPFLLGGFAE